jgi:dolichol-phosphate mannosyltransferase
MATKKLIFFPTYNEAGNVASMLARISQAVPEADILIIDDSSCDGTLDILASCRKDNLKSLVRPRKLGIGTAHLLAWLYALHHEYDILVTTDGDHTHDPAEIPMLLAKLHDGNDLVFGSRYIQGGRCDYAWYRRSLSLTANVAARRLLQIKLSEFTDAYRAFRVRRLLELDLGSLVVSGFSFFFMSLVQAHMRGLRIGEVPIHVHNRNAGASKLTPLEIFRGMGNLMRLTANRYLKKTTNDLCNERMSCPMCGCEYSRMILHGNTNAKRTGARWRLKEVCLFCGAKEIATGCETPHAQITSE